MVEHRRIKTKAGLTKEIKTGEATKIPETAATVLIHNDKDLEVTRVPQSELTSDCWLVQFRGFKACTECEVYLKTECGGGATLAKMIIDHFSDSIMTKMEYNKYFGDKSVDKRPTFHGWLKHTKGEHAFRYSLKKYKNHIEQLKIIAADPEGPDLDALYPFLRMFKGPNNKIIEQTGYHQHLQCDCDRTTKKGSYRDVVIEQFDETGAFIRKLYYYHQHCIMVREMGTIWLNSAGFRTTTTKERINRYLNEWTLYSQKRAWILDKRKWTRTGCELIKGPIRFYDGIKLEDI